MMARVGVIGSAMRNTFRTVTLVLGLALAAGAGCKKDKGTAATGSGSAGSDTAGSMTAGSGTATMTGSGSATVTGSGSATVTGSGSAAATGDRPPGITPEIVELNTKLAAIAKETVAELEAAKGDCKKMATALDTATVKIKPVSDKLGPMLDKLDEASSTYYGEKMVGDLAAAFGAMDPILATCKDDQGVITAATNYTKTLTGEE
jgi:hypothetical protein